MKRSREKCEELGNEFRFSFSSKNIYSMCSVSKKEQYFDYLELWLGFGPHLHLRVMLVTFFSFLIFLFLVMNFVF